MTSYRQILTWRPMPRRLRPAQDRLEEILRSWEGTPYMKGQQEKGVGADCVRFVTAVMDEMFGIERAMPRLPQDVALHRPDTARAAIKQMLSMYPKMSRRRHLVPLQPADILITGQSSGGPGHAIIVGASPNTLWQALPRGIYPGGLALMEGEQRLYRVLRFRDRLQWLK